MRHKDLFSRQHSLLNPKCLAWTENHEHAVFSVEDEIHPKAVVVWLGFIAFFPPDPTLCKYQRVGDEWELVESSVGEVPLVNHNPFDPRKQNAASNTAESVFPQNR